MTGEPMSYFKAFFLLALYDLSGSAIRVTRDFPKTDHYISLAINIILFTVIVGLLARAIRKPLGGNR